MQRVPPPVSREGGQRLGRGVCAPCLAASCGSTAHRLLLHSRTVAAAIHTSMPT